MHYFKKKEEEETVAVISHLSLSEQHSTLTALCVQRELDSTLFRLATHSASGSDSRHGHVHIHVHVHARHIHTGHVHVDGWSGRTHQTAHCNSQI